MPPSYALLKIRTTTIGLICFFFFKQTHLNPFTASDFILTLHFIFEVHFFNISQIYEAFIDQHSFYILNSVFIDKNGNFVKT